VFHLSQSFMNFRCSSVCYSRYSRKTTPCACRVEAREQESGGGGCHGRGGRSRQRGLLWENIWHPKTPALLTSTHRRRTRIARAWGALVSVTPPEGPALAHTTPSPPPGRLGYPWGGRGPGRKTVALGNPHNLCVSLYRRRRGKDGRAPTAPMATLHITTGSRCMALANHRGTWTMATAAYRKRGGAPVEVQRSTHRRWARELQRSIKSAQIRKYSYS
jgi:hypothetical protein